MERRAQRAEVALQLMQPPSASSLSVLLASLGWSVYSSTFLIPFRRTGRREGRRTAGGEALALLDHVSMPESQPTAVSTLN